MEPPGPHLHRRPAAPNLLVVELTPGPVRLAAAAAAGALALTSSGDVVLLVVALGLAAGDVVAGAVAAVALAALAVRWGTTSLDAIAGAQAVLGPGGFVGSAAAMLSAWCGAAALAAIAPARWPALAFGAAAALSVAGPGPGGLADLVVRAVGTVAGAAVALAAGRRLPRRPALVLSAVLASGALALALAVAG